MEKHIPRDNKKEESNLVKNEFKGYFNISSIIYDISLKYKYFDYNNR